MIIKSVFIIGDIGLGKDNSYHVGDEAMFLSNVYRYSQLGYMIYASSRSLSHQSNDAFIETLDIYINTRSKFNDLIDALDVSLSNLFKNIPEYFKNTINNLICSDILHISGGGNINSLWPGHIYYRAFMIAVAKKYGKKVILTSQTIGPYLTNEDKEIVSKYLRRADFIGYRDPINTPAILRELCGETVEIAYTRDDAYGDRWNKQRLDKREYDNSDNIKIKLGLILHRWSLNSNNYKKLKRILRTLFVDENLKIYLIPHQFDIANNGDIGFMEDIIETTELRDRVEIYNYKRIVEEAQIHKMNFSQFIYSLSLEMDYIITSRYHGIVFAINADVHVLAINYDRYYEVKNKGVLSYTFANSADYMIDINDNFDKILHKLSSFIYENDKYKEVPRVSINLLDIHKLIGV